LQSSKSSAVRGVDVMAKRTGPTKKMRIVFPDEKPPVVAIAEFDFEYAPKTCTAVWNYLESLGGSFTGETIHAMFAGRELAISDFNIPEVVPLENSTVTPAPGEILYMHFPAGIERAFPHEIKELAIFYGPDSRIFVPIGWVPGNVCARVRENLEGLAAVGNRVRFEGVKRIRFELVK